MSLGVTGAVSHPRAGRYKGDPRRIYRHTHRICEMSRGGTGCSVSSYLQTAGQFCPVPPGPA